jgi:transcriptional regulator with XRE-family HTH domain
MPAATRADDARTDAPSAPTVLRILLGTQLRRLRESRGVSATEAARAIRASESKISRIELGRNSVREVDVADLLDLYGITDTTERDQLLDLASQSNEHGWWHHYQDVLPTWFQVYLGLEESAKFIRSFDVQFVPGLLQTEEYSQAVIELGSYSQESTERMVHVRQERQRRFTAGGLRLAAVIDEGALRRPVGSVNVMRGQLRHLLRMADRPGLTLQVTPLRTGASYAAPGSFSILSFVAEDLPDIVYVEQLTSALYLDKPSDIERYGEALDLISATSTPPGETSQFIRSMLAEQEEIPSAQHG